MKKQTYDPLSGILIVYDKRIRRGVMKADKSGKFLRMNPKTTPQLDRAIYDANNAEIFGRIEVPSTLHRLALNPPLVIRSTFITGVDVS